MARIVHCISFMITLVELTIIEASICNTKTEFSCNDSKTCIQQELVCDHIKDCPDGSDEKNCKQRFGCSGPLWLRCPNGRCIRNTLVCDGGNDCGDFSDEKNCPAIQGIFHAVCPLDLWRCPSGRCIYPTQVCDGNANCEDGADEQQDCKAKETPCTQFWCNTSKECIPEKWTCDGTYDCKDKSDELECGMPVKEEDCTADLGLMWCSKNEYINHPHCIWISQYCYENVTCIHPGKTKSLCQYSWDDCAHMKCSYRCAITSSGPKCVCPKLNNGFVEANGTSCNNHNECKSTYGTCSQKCQNTPHAYKCYCDKGYTLQSDGRTCKIQGSEGLMIFSTKTEIRGYYLESEIYFPIAKNVNHGVGVAYEGNHVYWTELFSENESIVRSLEDGTHKEIIVTSGIGSPEDLAIDWITGNIYFTDAEIKHIGVCTNNGIYCTVLVNQDVNKPRSIVLDPEDGEMYWTDWGKRPEIAKSKMDGTEDISFVSNAIYWPNGLALDKPNQRLYWADAKTHTLESITLDGTDRRVILDGIVKHPFALDVFEDRIYWSDWDSHTIESCDKFTGKRHQILIKQDLSYVYGIHIYHSVLQNPSPNRCNLAFCSHICLLSGNSYSCACPENMVLATDEHTCKQTTKDQLLVIGTNTKLWKVQFQELGKHNVTEIPVVVQNIGAMAFGSSNNSLFISDVSMRSILEVNLYTNNVNHLLSDNGINHISAMDFDNLGHNLYWCDSGKGSVEVLNLNTLSRKVLLSDMIAEAPSSIVLVPHEGIMFVAFQTKKLTTHIDRMNMDGSNRMHVLEKDLMGPLHLAYDSYLNRVFWSDFGTGNIESTSTEGDDRHDFRSLQTNVNGITSLNRNMFWIKGNTQTIYWANSVNSANSLSKQMTLDIPKNAYIKHIISVTPSNIENHPCLHNNGNCSDLCLVALNSAVCDCPLGLQLSSDKHTCVKSENCNLNQFFCKESRICIPRELVCNSHIDCTFGEDEQKCTHQNDCPEEYFQCKDKECIPKFFVCDQHPDCLDKSDEINCNYNITCPENKFKCNDGSCIEKVFVCNGQKNCLDGSDEENCKNVTCNSAQFRCSAGSCIAKHWECDQEIDCPDGSDEHENCGYATCKAPKFLCKNGFCIDGSLKCNKINDCGDSSDEIMCESKKDDSKKDTVTTCKPNEFQCFNNIELCFPMSVRCNGTSECPHHEDEQGCTDCQIDEFECKNKKCIPTQWLCDNVNDCGDNSDEHLQFCAHKQNSTSVNINNSCGVEEYRCRNGQCISLKLLCNNVENCNDGSDENGACSISCLKDSNPCSDVCIKTPGGPQCICNRGYQLRGDGHTCTDVKECLIEPPVCSQLCSETIGSYICSCYEGYVLRADQTSCKSIKESMSLIFATSNEIHQLSQSNNTLKVIYSANTSFITGIDVSVEKLYVYFSTEETGSLHRIHIRKQTRESITKLQKPHLVAVDWITENVYVTTGLLQKAIQICNFEQKYCSKILSTDVYSAISALAVDAVNKYLFYTISKWQVFRSFGTVIYKCNLDGSQPQQISPSHTEFITGITYNVYKKILYYMDGSAGYIYKMQYDGSNQAKIIGNLTKPHTLTTYDDHLYFYTKQEQITLCPLYKDYQACRSYKVNDRFNEFFVIFHSSRQPFGRNPCLNHTCQNLCVNKNNEAQCICDFNKVNTQEHDCENKEVKMVTYSSKSIKAAKNNELQQSSSSKAIVVTIILVVFILALILGVYYYLRKRQSGHFNFIMRFQNPVYGFLQDNTQEVMFQPGQHEYYNPMEACGEKQVNTNNLQEKLVF